MGKQQRHTFALGTGIFFRRYKSSTIFFQSLQTLLIRLTVKASQMRWRWITNSCNYYFECIQILSVTELVLPGYHTELFHKICLRSGTCWFRSCRSFLEDCQERETAAVWVNNRHGRDPYCAFCHLPKFANVKYATLIPFLGWVIPHFPLLALWFKKNWLPSMKVEKFENSLRKMGLKWCKWSSLNAPGTQSCHSHSILELGDSPFPIISPLG